LTSTWKPSSLAVGFIAQSRHVALVSSGTGAGKSASSQA
jgi:hypothetical protein